MASGSVSTQGLQAHSSSAIAYRKCAPLPVDGTGCQPVAHFPWQASWPIAQKKLASFIESVLFKNMFEKEVTHNCANKQSASEIVSMQTFQDVFKPLKEAVAPPPPKDEADQEVTPESDEVPGPKDAVVDVPIDLE